MQKRKGNTRILLLKRKGNANFMHCETTWYTCIELDGNCTPILQKHVDYGGIGDIITISAPLSGIRCGAAPWGGNFIGWQVSGDDGVVEIGDYDPHGILITVKKYGKVTITPLYQ